MIRLLPIVSLLLVSIILMVPLWAFADTYQYRVPISIYNNGSADQGPVGIIVSLNNAQMVELGYINAAGLNTNFVAGTADQAYTLTDESVGIFIESISGYQTNSYNYRLGNFPGQSGLPVIVGPTGNITVADDSDMELGNNFNITLSGYIDTSAGSDKYLLRKLGAFSILVPSVNNITAGIFNSGSASDESSDSDSYLLYTDAVYATAWGAAVAEGEDDSGDYVNIGQTDAYAIYRSFFHFPTGDLPDDAIVTSSSLRVYCSSDYSDTDFFLTIQNGQPTYPSDPVVVADYDESFYSGNGGSLTTVGLVESGWNTITMNATGMGWINVTGDTKLSIRSSREIAGTVPTGDEYIRVYSQDFTTMSYEPEIFVNYTSESLTVTANGVSSGEHTINVTADTTNLKLYVDGSEEDSTALGGGSVLDNGNDWYLDQNGVMPYLTSYQHYVGGVQKCWFEPTVMASSTNLPDRSGNGNTGTMNFGSPSWAEATVGGVLPASAYVAPGGAGTGEPPDVLPRPIDITLHEDPGATGVGLPLYDSVNRAAGSMGLSAPVLYTILMLIVCIVVGFGGFVASGSLLGFSVGFGITAAAAGGVADSAGAHVFPWWIALVCVMMAIMTGYAWRHT